MNSPRFALALAAGKLFAAFCRVFAPKRGSNGPGAVALKLDPRFLKHVRGIDPAKTVFITGTNGKSTSTNMVVHALKTAGYTVCSNIEGANMKPGAAAALIKNTTLSGRFTKEYLILEVDERSLPFIAEDLKPGHVCVTNIQKDQVQRNGEPDYIYRKIEAVIDRLDNLTLYLNNDEPRSFALGWAKGQGPAERATGGERDKARILRTFGVAQNSRASETEADWGVSMPCPVCHDALSFSHFNLAGVGAFHCPSCGFCPGEEPDTLITGVDYEANIFHAAGETYRLTYPAAFFLYNHALCICLCTELGVGPIALETAFETFENIAGRTETFTYAGKNIKYMRIKQENPETLQSALDTIADDRGNKAFVLGPAVVDDIVPNYSNTFYTFDCNFSPLTGSGVERYICFGNTIAWDTANRLRYAGVPDAELTILDTDDDMKILDAIAACETKNIYLITWIKKYEKLKEHVG